MQERIDKAKELFASGLNCAQAVVVAFADLYDLDDHQASKISLAFGGGIGRMRLTCGAACGLFLLSGLHGEQNKIEAYKNVQLLADKFKLANGSITCSELLGAQKLPCKEIVANAAKIFAEYIKEN